MIALRRKRGENQEVLTADIYLFRPPCCSDGKESAHPGFHSFVRGSARYGMLFEISCGMKFMKAKKQGFFHLSRWK